MECLHLRNSGFWKLKENNSEETSKQKPEIFNLKFRSLQAELLVLKDETNIVLFGIFFFFIYFY